MVVTINGQEIESDDPKVIARAVAKANREEKQREAEQRQRREVAWQRAMAEGYLVYQWKHIKDSSPRYWPANRAGDGAPFRITEDGYLIAWTRHGELKSYCGRNVVGVLTIGPCLTTLVAVFLRDRYATEPQTNCYAVGVCEAPSSDPTDNNTMVSCPGVNPEDFTPIGQESAT